MSGVVIVSENPEPAPPVNPWSVPLHAKRSTSQRILIGLSVVGCTVAGLYIVAGVLLMIVVSNSRAGNK